VVQRIFAQIFSNVLKKLSCKFCRPFFWCDLQKWSCFSANVGYRIWSQTTLGAIFAQIFRYFAKIFRDFQRERILNNQNLHPFNPCVLHHWPGRSTNDWLASLVWSVTSKSVFRDHSCMSINQSN